MFAFLTLSEQDAQHASQIRQLISTVVNALGLYGVSIYLQIVI